MNVAFLTCPTSYDVLKDLLNDYKITLHMLGIAKLETTVSLDRFDFIIIDLSIDEICTQDEIFDLLERKNVIAIDKSIYKLSRVDQLKMVAGIIANFGTCQSAEKSTLFTWVIGASSMGPSVLKEFFTDISLPKSECFIVAQHIDQNSVRILKEQLERVNTSLRIVLLADGMMLEENTVYILPPVFKLIGIDSGIVRLSLADESQRFLPSVDDTIVSVSKSAPGRCGVIIMTGLGDDGAVGISRASKNIVHVLCQSPDDAPVKFMPEAALKTNLVTYVGTVNQLSSFVSSDH